MTDPASFKTLTARVMFDDGFVIYLNGTEVKRGNMPTGMLTFGTNAASVRNANFAYDTFDLTPFRSLLVPGRNVIAAEVHQVHPSNSHDLVFDLMLEAGP